MNGRIAQGGGIYNSRGSLAGFVNTDTGAEEVIGVRPQTLTDGATVAWDADLGNFATVTVGGNRTIAAPTNLRPGTYILVVIQDGTGSRTITWNSVFKWAAGTAPTLTTTAAAKDIFTFVCDGTSMYGAVVKDFR